MNNENKWSNMIINLSTFPNSSGIYMFKSNNDIIYIGSSKNLYKRMSAHNTEIKKGLNAKCNPALYQFLSANSFTVEFHLTDNYREEEQELIDKYKPIYNSIRAFIGLGAYKGREAEYMKQYYETHKEEMLEQKKQYYENHKEQKKQYNNQYYDSHKEQKKQYNNQYYDSHKEEMKQYQNQYYDSHKEEVKQYQNQYNNQQCLYNGETLTLCALSMRFRKQGIPHPTIEAKKYLI